MYRLCVYVIESDLVDALFDAGTADIEFGEEG